MGGAAPQKQSREELRTVAQNCAAAYLLVLLEREHLEFL